MHHTLPGMATQYSTRANPGLEGVVAAETHLSHVDGERGELIVAGHRLEELVRHDYEDVVAELWEAAGVPRHGRVAALPLPASTLALLRAAAQRGVAPDGRAPHGGRHAACRGRRRGRTRTRWLVPDDRRRVRAFVARRGAARSARRLEPRR